MESEREHEIDSEDQFWAELDKLLSAPYTSPEATDDCLRSYLAFGVNYADSYLSTEEDLAQYAYRLRIAPVFTEQADYVRRQFVYGLLQEDDPATLHIFAVVLLYDGRANEPTFDMMKAEGAFPRLIELVQTFSSDEEHSNLHRLLLNLIYEMARILTLEWHDLATITDAFITSLLSLIESGFSDETDPYHYRAIRVLLVMNEQYMVVASQPPRLQPGGRPSPPLTNRVLKAINTYASVYKTFGENLIYLLNREKEAILQIQILKLLYLIFASRTTAEYFYTNDLHVLVDIILRMLRNLPADSDYLPDEDDPNGSAMTQALRHTYLRVLHHVLENSQLRHPGMEYKRTDILVVLDSLSGRRFGSFAHFAPMDATTVRLAERCRGVTWLRDPDEGVRGESPARANGAPVNGLGAPGAGHMDVARRSLGMTVQGAGESLVEVATHMERPGVTVPSPAVREAEST